MAENRDFAEFYAASFVRLTSQLYVHTNDLAEAQDVVQEAMVKALDRWSTLSQYDDPSAWVRRVAWNLATSRWRRLRRGFDLVTRGRHDDAVPGPEPDRIAVVEVLADLPARQRQAIILHYLEDLPVAEVADLTGASVGTVKSWLHRGRATLAARLSDNGAGREVDHV